jgi:hypothetical protein
MLVVVWGLGVLWGGSGVATVLLRRYERAGGIAIRSITPKLARFVPICAGKDIGMKDDWADAQQVFILRGVAKEMGGSTANGEEPSAWVR